MSKDLKQKSNSELSKEIIRLSEENEKLKVENIMLAKAFYKLVKPFEECGMHITAPKLVSLDIDCEYLPTIVTDSRGTGILVGYRIRIDNPMSSIVFGKD